MSARSVESKAGGTPATSRRQQRNTEGGDEMNANINGTLDDVTIYPIASRYTEGAWAQVRAKFHWRFEGRVTVHEERIATAAAHRLVASLLEATPREAGWCLPQVELVAGYRDIVEIAITVELTHGSEAEKNAALELFHDVIPPPEA